MTNSLSYGMVGGSTTSFIGGVHRAAVRLDGTAKLKAGCFSADDSKNKESGQSYKLEKSRVYNNYYEMAEQEGKRCDKIDFVTIVTPNSSHFEIAKAFLIQNIHVLCEKPLCLTYEQGIELKRIAEERKLLFCVNYSYTGNVMVKAARQLITDGVIGEIVSVRAQYLQQWMVDKLKEEKNTSKSSVWRADPAYSGSSNCVGDIGTHIENTVAYITGLKIKRLCAHVDYFGCRLDLNAHIMVEYDNGAAGVYSCSQVCIGHNNDLSVSVFGTDGSVHWREEASEELILNQKSKPPQIYTRGAAYLPDSAKRWERVPSGHPEGFCEAFGNIYKAFTAAVLKLKQGETLSADAFDYPGIDDGIDGVRFITAVIESGKNGSAWVQYSKRLS